MDARWIGQGKTLAKQAVGPPVIYALPVAKQLQQRLDELVEPYDNLKTTLVAIINRVEGDEDNKNFDYYTEGCMEDCLYTTAGLADVCFTTT